MADSGIRKRTHYIPLLTIKVNVTVNYSKCRHDFQSEILSCILCVLKSITSPFKKLRHILLSIVVTIPDLKEPIMNLYFIVNLNCCCYCIVSMELKIKIVKTHQYCAVCLTFYLSHSSQAIYGSFLKKQKIV